MITTNANVNDVDVDDDDDADDGVGELLPISPGLNCTYQEAK